MDLDFSEEYRVRAKREEVWGFLQDYQNIKDCLPGVEDASIDGDHITAKMSPPVKFVKGGMTAEIDLSVVEEGREMDIDINAESFGGSIHLILKIKLEEEGETTVLDVDMEGEAGGLLKSAPDSLVEGAMDMIETKMLNCLKGKLEEEGEEEEIGFENVEIERDSPLAVLKIDRTESVNSIDKETLKEIHEALMGLEESGDFRAIVLTGKGGNFSSGSDLKELKDCNKEEAEELSSIAEEITHMLDDTSTVTVAAVEGNCLGAGLELATACDFILATSGSNIGLPEVRRGLIPGYGGITRLVRLIGLARAKSLILSGEPVSGAKAEIMGLVEETVEEEELLERAKELAEEIAESTAPVAYRKAKRLMKIAMDEKEERVLEQTRKNFAQLFETEDLEEGIEAFLDDRDADFEGK